MLPKARKWRWSCAARRATPRVGENGSAICHMPSCKRGAVEPPVRSGAIVEADVRPVPRHAQVLLQDLADGRTDLLQAKWQWAMLSRTPELGHAQCDSNMSSNTHLVLVATDGTDGGQRAESRRVRGSRECHRDACLERHHHVLLRLPHGAGHRLARREHKLFGAAGACCWGRSYRDTPAHRHRGHCGRCHAGVGRETAHMRRKEAIIGISPFVQTVSVGMTHSSLSGGDSAAAGPDTRSPPLSGQ